jgi:pyruvate-formate lyase-activating enzyme
MSGGFTLSGGEPLMQHRFAVKLLAAAKLGVHTGLKPTATSVIDSPTRILRTSIS